MKAFWWKGQVNFGDTLTPALLERVAGIRATWTEARNAEIIVVGSILTMIPPLFRGTVLGAGKADNVRNVNLSQARVLALRGQLTADGVQATPGYALGDPGLLADMLLDERPEPIHDLGVVPHWQDRTLLKRYPNAFHIDPKRPALDVVRDIADCKRIVSSSLHGIIVADALELPRRWETFMGVQGGGFKFHDYASAWGGTITPGEWGTIPAEARTALREGLLAAFAQLGEPDEKPTPQVSVIIPFREDRAGLRGPTKDWVEAHWRWALPDAQIIVSPDSGEDPFCKAEAVNNGYRLATGNVLIVADADTICEPKHLKVPIERALATNRLVVPWQQAYRPDDADSATMMAEAPDKPLHFPHEIRKRSPHTVNNTTAAMVYVISKLGFEMVEGMDGRMRGWGYEDVCFRRACSALLGRPFYMTGEVISFSHPRPRVHGNRVWDGDAGRLNAAYSRQYVQCGRDAEKMLAVVRTHSLNGESIPYKKPASRRERGPIEVIVNRPTPTTRSHAGERIRI
jgi:hypothetical protein